MMGYFDKESAVGKLLKNDTIPWHVRFYKAQSDPEFLAYVKANKLSAIRYTNREVQDFINNPEYSAFT